MKALRVGCVLLCAAGPGAPGQKPAKGGDPLPAPSSSISVSGYGTSGEPLKSEFPLGKVAPNVACRGNEALAYHVYLPRGLQQGRTYPVMFIISGTAGKPAELERFLDGAEQNGMILVMSAVGGSENFDRAMSTMRAAIPDALNRLPADRNRLYVSGHAAGSRVAVLAANEMMKDPVAGVMLSAAGAGTKEMGALPKSTAVIGMSASNTTLRWDMACVIYKYTQTRHTRLMWFPGQSQWGSKDQIADAMTWLNGTYLRDEKGRRMEALRERETFAAMVIDRAEAALAQRPEWASEWVDFLQKFPVPGSQAGRLRGMAMALDKNPKIAAYRRVAPEIDKFARKHFATSPKAYREKNGTPEANRDASALLAKYGDTAWTQIIKEFGAPAKGGGGH